MVSVHKTMNLMESGITFSDVTLLKSSFAGCGKSLEGAGGGPLTLEVLSGHMVPTESVGLGLAAMLSGGPSVPAPPGTMQPLAEMVEKLPPQCAETWVPGDFSVGKKEDNPLLHMLWKPKIVSERWQLRQEPQDIGTAHCPRAVDTKTPQLLRSLQRIVARYLYTVPFAFNRD